jgi:hypothetical protein
MPELPIRGRCTCGAVRFEVDQPLVGAVFCHCTRCQHRTGSAFSVTALTAPGSFRLVGGEEQVRAWDPGDGGWVKAFCGSCGGHVFTHDPRREALSVRMGAIEGDPGVRPSAHQFADYAVPWLALPDDGLPRFPERRPGAAPPER